MKLCAAVSHADDATGKLSNGVLACHLEKDLNYLWFMCLK